MVPRHFKALAEKRLMPVVVVESPAKAKTINKYLGSDYVVLASYGHVRDLPAKDGSVDTDNDFRMEWEIAPESKKHIRAITEALKTDDTLILATDVRTSDFTDGLRLAFTEFQVIYSLIKAVCFGGAIAFVSRAPSDKLGVRAELGYGAARTMDVQRRERFVHQHRRWPPPARE